MIRTIQRALLTAVAALALAVALVPGVVHAEGRLELVGATPLVLPSAGGEARFTVRNAGDAPVTVTSVALPSAELPEPGARALPGAVVEGLAVEPGTLPVTLAPGEGREVRVTWRRAAAREVYARVLVRSDAPHAAVLAAGVVSGPSSFLADHILSLLTFLPVAGMLVLFALWMMKRDRDENLVRAVALVATGAQLALAAWLVFAYDAGFSRADGNEGFQFVEHAVWIRGFNIEYYLGVDGISVSMVFLTALISFLGVIVSWKMKNLLGFFAMYLLLDTGMMGVFVALDFFLFYVFWEVMLLPMYFLIGIWGGPRKEYAAIKFFLYTLAGSVLMLLAIIALYYNANPTYLVDGTSSAGHTFSMTEMMRVDYARKTTADGAALAVLGLPLVKVAWVALFIGFAIKIPMFPFHTWLPDAHVEAPTPISVILAGVLLKMGAYGILRVNFSILPEASQWAAGTMAVFGVINILYGAFCAMAQEDLKKLVAYSSVSHMGYCLLGMAAMTPQGISGCIMQMFAHGVITAMLFTCVGVIYDRAHTRDLSRFGGLASEMPVYTAFVGVAFFASLGLPGLAGFIAEALTFIGAFPRFRALTILAATGVIFTAAYHLWAFQRMFLGKFREAWRHDHALEATGGRFPEITAREALPLAVLAVIAIVLGFYPMPVLTTIHTGVADLRTLLGVEPATVAAALALR